MSTNHGPRPQHPMVLQARSLTSVFVAACAGGTLVLACSQSASSDTNADGVGGSAPGSGGSTATIASGGANPTGGQHAMGGTMSFTSAATSIGTTSPTGGAAPTGGKEGTGGTKSFGGSFNIMGGAKATGGSVTGGGASSSGGKPNTGGAPASGVTASTGGATGAGGTRPMGGSATVTTTAGATATGGTSSGGGSAVTGPCDIYDAANTPCVAAHSTVRALYGKYAGRLYQVQRASDKQTKDIIVLGAGGFADSASQDTFCQNTTCTISIIYDQSPRGNDLKPAPGGGAVATPDNPVTANKLKLTVGGHTVYGAYFEGGQGYRNNSKTTGLAKNDEPESMYMVASGKHYNDKCCWDYGNAETTNNDDGEGTMEAIYFGDCSFWGKGSGNGPWIMADIENGLWAGNVTPNPTNTPMTSEYITAMVKGKSHTLGIKGGNAQSGKLTTFWEGAYPAKGATGKPYDPMKKQGAIILGIGGDNSNSGVGTFFEGCITTGYATTETDDAIQANIVAAGYGK